MPRTKIQNSLTNEELLSQILPQNIDLLDDFCEYLRSVKRSEKTISGYRNDIEIYFCWNLVHNGNKLFTETRKRDIIVFQSWMINENKNSTSRVRRVKAALSSFSNYIANVCDDEYKDFVPVVRKIESPTVVPVYEKTVLTPDQVQNILQTLTERRYHQLACLFALAISCGARKSQLLRFNVDFFKQENIIFGSLYKTPPIKTKGRSGGKYISKYVLVSTFKPYLDIWMSQRERLGIDCEELFAIKDRDGIIRPVVESTINAWTKVITEIIGKPFYWHAARHYWTSYLLRAGIPETVVTDLSGWDSINMVSTYDDREKDETFAKYFRDGRIVAHEEKHMSDL